MDIIHFATLDELHAWFLEHHTQAQELWIGFYKKDAQLPGVGYPEAVDEALCFGWIDGIRKKVDEKSYTNRFTPRKPRSNWSTVNIKRVGELIAAGRMQPAGLKAFEARPATSEQQYSYENALSQLSAEGEAQFKANLPAWEFFQAQAPYYKRTALWWVVSAKKEETRQKRLAELIADSAQGQHIKLLRNN